MRNLSAWAIRHPAVPLVVFTVLSFMGIAAYAQLPVNLYPDVVFPVVDVEILAPGTSPEELEAPVAQKVEGSLASVGNIRCVRTAISDGLVSITIQLQIGASVDRAVGHIRDAIAKTRANLPRNILEPTVRREDAESDPFAYYAVTLSSSSQERLSWIVDNTITKRLLAIPGVARIQRVGGVDREMVVELDPARLIASSVTPIEVNEQLRQLNLDAPGGRLQAGGAEQSIRVLGGARSARVLADEAIIAPGGRWVRLRDIAAVHEGTAEIRSAARLNGRPATAFGVYRARGASELSTDEAVTRALHSIVVDNPTLRVERVFTTVSHTEAVYHSSLSALFEGSALAVAVVWLFLRDLRATLFAALAIPLSAIPTFACLHWLGFSLNQITLLALALVAGVLVDDAIVEIENIIRHVRMSKGGYQAALDAADEIGLAVVATSFSIIAVFLPVSFMGGVSGQYFKQFGLTVAIAVFISLLVARAITPVLAAYTLGTNHPGPDAAGGKLTLRYLAILRWALSNRGKTIAGGAVFFVLSALGLATLPKAFLPADDFSTSIVNIELPPGGRLSDTEGVSATVAGILRRSPQVTDIVEFIGGAGDGDVATAQIYVSLVPPAQRSLSEKQWEQQMTARLNAVPDAHVSFDGMSFSGERDISLYLVGDTPNELERTGREVLDQLRTLREVRNPRLAGDVGRPEVLVHPRLDLTAELGVSVQTIADTVRIATMGDLPQNSARFSTSDRQIPIRVSVSDNARADWSTLENLPLRTSSGSLVPLKAVAELTLGWSPAALHRYNYSRRLYLDADLAPQVELGTAMDKVHQLPALLNLPAGVRLVDGGDAEFMDELFANFGLALMAGVLMVLAVLILLFARVLQPLTILSALPLSLGGAVLALILAHLPFSMPVVIGVLMLVGIVVKNSILLVDCALERIRAGQTRTEALIEAGRQRARPILMTTVAMVAGMLPAAVGLSGDSSFRGPMAIAVIGGLITSTVLTLVIVPAVFSVVDDVETYATQRLLSHLRGVASRLCCSRVRRRLSACKRGVR